MSYFKVAKSSPCRRLLPTMLLAALMASTACGGEGTVMKVSTDPIEGSATPADGITSVGIFVQVKKDGELQNEGTVSFSTDLGTFDNTSMETPVRKTSVELDMGQAGVQLYSVQAGTATVRVEYTDAETGLVDASTEISVVFNYALAPDNAKPATIEFISADPETIKIFNTSSEGQTSTKITFQVLDKLNLPIANQMIYFEIPKPLGEASLVPKSTRSDVNGYAVTYLTSGRVAGVAEIVAGTEVYNGDITQLSNDYVAGTAKIHVVAGSANYYNFSFGCERDSIGGFKWYGEQMECTAFVADRDSQEIPNQPVLFATEAGAVLPLIYTGSNGQAITTYTAQDPIPYPVTAGSPGKIPEQMQTVISHSDPIFTFLDGFPFFDEAPDDVVSLAELGVGTSSGEIWYTTPKYYYEMEEPLYFQTGQEGLRERNPRDGLVTLIAITGGEEPLIHDVNQNGECDNGDNFLSLGEPFIDRNDNGLYEIGEYFLDIDNNGVWTSPVGATNQNLPYLASADCSQWKKNTQIWKEYKIIWTGEGLFSGFMLRKKNTTQAPTSALPLGTNVTEEGVVVGYGESVILDIYILDRNLNAVAANAGDTIECAMEGEVDIEVTPASQPASTRWGPARHGQISISGIQKDPMQPKPGTAMIMCSFNLSLGDKHTYSESIGIAATVVQ